MTTTAPFARNVKRAAALASAGLLTALGLAFAVPSSASAADVPTCNGLVATIVGTDRADDIEGTRGDDVIVGLAGNDELDGNGGNDTICGTPATTRSTAAPATTGLRLLRRRRPRGWQRQGHRRRLHRQRPTRGQLQPGPPLRQGRRRLPRGQREPRHARLRGGPGAL